MSFIFGEDQATSKTTSTMPDYIKDASRSAISKAESIANQPYQQYEGPRVASMSGAEQTGLNLATQAAEQSMPQGATSKQYRTARQGMKGALDQAENISAAAIPQFGRAQEQFGQAGQSAGSIYDVGEEQFGQAGRSYSGAESTAVDATRSAQPTYEMQAPTLQRAKQTASDVAGRSFPDQAGRYMSPYVSEALAPAMEDLRVQSARLQQQGDADAISQGGRGAFGGARAGIEAAERQERTQEEMSAMLSEGYRQAYDRAQQAFAEDERRRLAASGRLGGLAGTGADIYGQEVSQRMQGAGLRADIAGGRTQLGATQSETMAQQAQSQRALGEAISQDAARRADVAAQQAQAERAASGALADMAGAQSQTRRAAASTAMSAGQLPRQIEQQSMDVAYQDFEEQRDWDKRGLDSYLRALRGTPYEETQTQVRTPSTGQQIGQLAGAVTAGVGAYNTFF